MQTKNLLFSLLLITFTFTFSQAQESPESLQKELSLDGGSIQDQFEYITRKSNSFQEYKVVKKTWLGKLEANILDSIRTMKSELAGMHSAETERKEEIAALQAETEAARSELEAAIATKNSIAFLGIQTHKNLYNSIMWGLVLGLAALLLLFIFRFRRSHAVTAEAVKNLEETKKEFETHRKRALEREQKLNRRLQDELNKQIS